MIDSLKNKITLADSLELIQTLPDKCIDLVFTDPPYGINMAKNAGLSDKYTDKNWDNERPPHKMFDEILRVSKNQIIFGGNYFYDLLPLGFWAVWDKRCGVIPERTYADGEMLWLSYKKPLRIFRYIWDGMLQDCMKNKDVRFHPTQKPLKLCEKIITYYTGLDKLTPKNGFIIADFYSGSGTIAVACHNLGIDFIAIEKDVEYFNKSTQRLSDVQSQLKLNLVLPLGGVTLMIEVDTSELKKYVKNLKNVAKDAYPKTVRSTLERMGFETTKEYKANVRKNLTIRGNKKTNIVVASIGYEKPSSSLKINDMQCIAGQKSMKYGKKNRAIKKTRIRRACYFENKIHGKTDKILKG